MKRWTKNFKLNLISCALISSLLTPIALISCSNNKNSQLTYESVQEQFNKFSNSLVKEEVKNNLYFENFLFNENNKTLLSLDQIGLVFSIPNLSSSYEYEFILSKNNNNNLINIDMRIIVKNENQSFLRENIKVLENVKSLTSEEIKNIKDIYNNWTIDNIEIKNTITNQTLTKDKYNTILPSYLSLENITITNNKINSSIQNNNYSLNIDVDFNDFLGNINLTLDIINNKTGLKFYFTDSTINKTVLLEGFVKSLDRNNEITNIYSKLSRTFNMNSLIGKENKIPYLSSGITTIDQILQLFNAIKNNLSSTTENTDLNNIINIIQESKNQSSWYKLTITTTANDITGNLIINWTIIDNFTGNKISPSNINKITTINEMLSLKKNEIIDDKELEDLSAIDAGYDSYNLLKTLEINSKYSSKASTIQSSTINLDWIITNTNIKSLFSDIKKSNDGNYLEFSMTKNEKQHFFRFNVTNTNNIISNDIEGTIKIPFIMQIKCLENFKNSTSLLNKMNKNDNNLVEQYIDFLPPNGKSSTGTGETYNSALRSANIVIGGYLTNDIELASVFYDGISSLSSKSIEIQINNENYFNEVLNKCLQDETQMSILFESEIKEKIIDSLNANNSDKINEIKNLLDKYIISFSLKKNVFPTYDVTNKTITSSEVDVRLISSGTDAEKIIIPYYKSGTQTEFPKSKIIIKLVSMTN